MPLAPKTRLGPYEIVAPLGSGGMGEVYRALDTRLERTVAIKICTGRFTDRFEREVRAISSLNHPHICALYDIGREGQAEFLVMEYLEGESLEQRLRGGPLPVAEAVRCAIQVASALDAAHRKGIVHRDLKPGNIVLTASGAKLLDFGLAKMAERRGEVAGSQTALATVAQPLTAEGTILGTFQYMAPEQLEGKEADARSDIFAFGSTLYEMMTGRKAFEGPSQASLITAVMSADPPAVSSLQPMASPALDRLIRKCLVKAPDNRWQTASDLLSELEWIAEAGSQAGVPAPVAAQRLRRGRAAWVVAGAAGVLLAASLYFTAVHLREKPALPAQVRFQIPAPADMTFRWFDVPAISPDGTAIAFTAGDGGNFSRSKLFVRRLDAAAPTAIALPGPSYLPFWSPDGRQIAYVDGGGALLKVSVAGGPPVTLCEGVSVPGGGAWSSEGVILVVVKGLLHRLPEGGGQPKPIGSLAKGEIGQRLPRFLPDGKHFLYSLGSNQTDRQGIYVGSLDAGTPKLLVAGAVRAEYVDSGHLLFVRSNTIFAQPFDPRSLALRGEARPVTDRVSTATGGPLNALFAASPAGVLIWRTGSSTAELRLQWFDHSGKKLETVGDVADYSNPALSPDGSKLAIGITDPQTKTRDVWVLDLLRGTRTRLTFDAADDLNPVWSPDGVRIAFTSDRKGDRDIYVMPADGSAQAELLIESDGQKNVEDWSRDGKFLIYNHQPGTQRHLYLLPLAGGIKPTPFLKSELRTTNSQFSADGRWVSYTSSETGRNEIYVQGLDPDTLRPRGKWQVSTAGGDDAHWRSDGKAMFYYSGRSIMEVDVESKGGSFSAGIPHPLFDVRVPTSGRNHFVVSRDGKRFLAVTLLDDDQNLPLEVLVNWR